MQLSYTYLSMCVCMCECTYPDTHGKVRRQTTLERSFSLSTMSLGIQLMISGLCFYSLNHLTSPADDGGDNYKDKITNDTDSVGHSETLT